MSKRKGSALNTDLKMLHTVQLGSAICLFVLLYFGKQLLSSLDIVQNPLFVTQLMCGYMVLESGLLYYSSKDSASVGFRSASSTSKQKGIKAKISQLIVPVGYVLLSIPIFHIIAIMFGAPLLESFSATLSFSCLLTFSSVLHMVVMIGPSIENWIRILQSQSKQGEGGTEFSSLVIGISSIVGAWFGAFPIPLDWDRDWQVWPISCLIGILLGHCAGLVISSVIILLNQYRQDGTKII